MKYPLKSILKKLKDYNSRELIHKIETNSILIAKVHIERIRKLTNVNALDEVEFKVFSEWGEDGIIQYLINNTEIKNKTFVEFGVQDYKESNTRFLLINDFWKGLIIDSNQDFISSIKKDEIYFKYNLEAVKAFVTKDNINNLISSSGIKGEIGLLSVDIDGNDYWIWQAINIIDPVIVICEYNALFGKSFPVSIPYTTNFERTKAHYSNLYFGASLQALINLAGKKGYDFVGSNSAGCNAFFVKKLFSAKLKKFNTEKGYRKPGFRQSRNKKGELTFLNLSESRKLIEDMEVINTETGAVSKLKEIFESEEENILY